jgi:serine phosphatase RsbU (regulator of sigma subunit)
VPAPPAGAAPATASAPPAGQRGQRPPPPEPLDISKSDASHVVIDMAPIVREMMQKINPDVPINQWTPEMRQQLSRSISERLTGIQEGIRLSVSELEKKATEAKQLAAQSAKTADQSAATAAAATHRTSALAGNRLAVTVEQNGHVQQANAQINLDSLLKTIFSTTRRDQGEVPFAVAKDGKLYTATEADKGIVQGFGSVISPNAQLGRTVLSDWVIVTIADPTGSGLRFGIARPVGDSVAQLRKATVRNAGLGLLLIGLAIIGVVPVSQRLTRNVTALTEGVQEIARGDLGARVVVTSHDEVGALATAVNKMAEDLETHQRSLVGQERLKRELELGRQIQNEMLPHEPLRLGLTEVTGVSVPAREVGGDFFNYFALPTREVALLVGDVSGKGVGAALVMANIQATLRTRLALGQDLPVIADAIDREMDTGQPRSVYATLFVGILDPITKRLRYVNAGHHPQFVLRASGGLEGMHSTGLPIGLLSGRGYTQGVMQLAAGDFVFFYTDGIVEAEDAAGDFFGTPRLEAALVSAHKIAREKGTGDVLARVEQTVATFRGAREPLDDATMMAVRIG